MKRLLTTFILTISLCVSMFSKVIYEFDINDDIGSKSWIYTQKAFDEAEKYDASLIIVHLNTYGGEVVFADSIRTRILNSEIPTVVYIDNNAASAGALISIACDRIYMRKGGNIGAATVVSGTDGQAMPDKYQSYMRATMRSTAEAQGRDSLGNWVRDPQIAEAMVDDRISITGVIDSGKTLTFTAEEALSHNYCNAIVESVDEIIALEGYEADTYELVTFKPSGWDNIKGFLTGTALRGILIMLIIGGIYFELQTPGIGFALGVSIVAAVLYFAPLYIDGVAAYWEIILFIIGIGLLLMEIFVIPGFGIAGISGIICIIAGLTFSMLDNDYFNFEQVRVPDVGNAAFTVFFGLVLSTIAIIWLTSRIGAKGLFHRLALDKAQNMEEGYIGVPVTPLFAGEQGVAITDMRPSGKIEIAGKRYDAMALHGFIEKGTPIIVKRYETGQIYVDPI